MAENDSTFDVLRQKVLQVLDENLALKAQLKSMEAEIEINKRKQKDLIVKNQKLVNENNQHKLASGLMGNEEHRRLMKLKINRYIKEIDGCISQLSNR